VIQFTNQTFAFETMVDTLSQYTVYKNLKDLGFKTYDSLWSEAYDTIMDVKQRQLAIVELLNNINSMTWDQTIFDQSQQIAYHNQTRLLNIGDVARSQMDDIIRQFKDYDPYQL